MRILVVGGGGREHSLVWKLSESAGAGKIFCAPGNGGIADIAECAGIRADDIEGIVSFSKREKIDLAVIGPDDPLMLGLADACEAAGIRAFGPRRAAARLEWSKEYAKALMKKYGVPTADYRVFGDAAEAVAALGEMKGPYFIKTDGLALGKGAVFAESRAEAEAAIRSFMIDKIFGEAGSRVLVEECLAGPEMTVLAFTDGKVIKPMLCSQDHKRIYDGDRGPNTGGMGAFAPSPVYTEAVERECREKIFAPTLKMLQQESIDYRGVLYFGLMLTPGGVKVIEYNSRFGDPEAQAVLPLLETDLLEVFDAVINGRLVDIDLQWAPGYCACVVAASGGYPGEYKTGLEITIEDNPEALLFHAGTRRENGRLYTAGGRVIGAAALGDTLGAAAERAYGGIRRVSFDGMHYRKDIGGSYRE